MQWHHSTKGDDIKSETVMDIMVNKLTTTSDQPDTSRGIRCPLYEGRKNLKRLRTDDVKFLATLQNINSSILLATIMPRKQSLLHSYQVW